MDKFVDQFKDKRVLILGLGLNQGGLGAAKFFAQSQARVKVTDLKTKEELAPSVEELKAFPNIEYTLGEHKLEDIDWADLIIRNPALKPDNQYLRYATEKDKKVEMDMGIFLQFVKPNQLIGVTGTKGKSTTSSMIYQVLKLKYPNLLFAGNIRKSVLEILPEITDETLLLLELSSFQLQAFDQHQISPKYAVITNIYPDHLNYHGTMESYVEAKRAITKYQTEEDYLFLKYDDKVTHEQQFLSSLKTHVVNFHPDDLPQDLVPRLTGQHNLFNMAAALAVAKTLGVEEKQALEILANFEGIPYRLQLIKEINGVKIYNDSASTTPQALIEALKSLTGAILVAGGMNKGLPYEEVAEAIDKHAKKVYFLAGDATEAIKNSLQDQEKIQGTYDDINQLVRDVLASANRGEVVLFSPGATSFNLFKNEFDRGEKFNQAVEKVLT